MSKTNPLPDFDVLVYCTECRYCIGTLRGNLPQLASVIFRVRKSHAQTAHDWEELND